MKSLISSRAQDSKELAGTKSLYDNLVTSRHTEDVRAQLASRVTLYYLLPELTLEEVKGIVQRALGEEATDLISWLSGPNCTLMKLG